MLDKGDTIPALTGINQEGKSVEIKPKKGKKLVLFFYPKANTQGCTAEACNLNENIQYLQKNNYQILGISPDSVRKQKNFHTKYKFEYDLIADEQKEIINIFGVWGRKKFMGREYDGVLRTTFIIDENLQIVERISDVKTKEHTNQIINN